MQFPAKIENGEVMRIESGSTLQRGRSGDLEHSGGKLESPSSDMSSNQVTRSKREKKSRSRSSNSVDKKDSAPEKESKSKSKKRSKKEKELNETAQVQPSS